MVLGWFIAVCNIPRNQAETGLESIGESGVGESTSYPFLRVLYTLCTVMESIV